MSDATTNIFPVLVRELYIRLLPILLVDQFEVEDRNPVWIGKIFSNAVNIEILFGPPEFKTQMFVTVRSKRYNLAAMYAMPGVRDWMLANKPQINANYDLKAEFNWIEKFISEAIRDKEEFKTIYRD